jgi:glyoxylase-like metal-dependent hydrolase (beta-lactamase superfamily II)
MLLESISDKIMLIDSPIKGVSGLLGTYLVSGEEHVIIDPGPTTQASGVLRALKEHNVKSLKAVLLTHIHLDHGGGTWKILDEYPDAYLYCHPRGAPHMIDPSKLKEGARRLFGDGNNEYGRITGIENTRVIESIDRDTIDLDGAELRVYWTPGHSSHSQCFFEPDSRTAIVGDAVGHNLWQDIPIIPTSPPPHNPEQAIQSIELIKSLDPEILCIAHFGAYKDPEKHLDRIKKRTNLWLRIATRAVNEGLSLEEFSDIVLQEDYMLSQNISDLNESEKTLKNSLLGFYRYAEWKKSR